MRCLLFVEKIERAIKFASAVSTNPICPQITCIETENTFFQNVPFIFVRKVYVIMLLYYNEIAPKFYATVFPLTHGTLYDKEKIFFIFSTCSAVYEKSSIVIVSIL